MPSRPQFSLRMLLFVMVMVCLAAATLHRAPPPDWHGSDQEWEDLGFAVHVQSWLRLAACVVFPAALVAAAVARGGYSRALCLGALLPAAIPMVLVTYDLGPINGGWADAFTYLAVMSYMLSERIAALWLCMPCIGFICVLACWLLPAPQQCDAAARRSFTVWLSFMVVFAVCASAAMIALPPSQVGKHYLDLSKWEPLAIGQSPSRAQIGPQSSAWRQVPVRLVLCLAVPAVLAAVAVQGKGTVRTFCACGMLPALVPAMLVSGIDILNQVLDGRWEPALTFQCRYFVCAMWALVPLFGLTGTFFYWLLQLGAAKANRRDDAVEKPG
jgi:hypothetical protein